MTIATAEKYLIESGLNQKQKTAVIQAIQPAIPEIIKNSAALEYLHSSRFRLPTTIIAIFTMPKIDMIKQKMNANMANPSKHLRLLMLKLNLSVLLYRTLWKGRIQVIFRHSFKIEIFYTYQFDWER